MVGKRSGRFSWKMERELIALAAKGATVSQIARHFETTAVTIELKAERLGIAVKPDDPGRRSRVPQVK